MKDVSKHFVGVSSLYVLGKGAGTAIAMEGALKLKETTYVHAEGFSSGALKHGPLAMMKSDIKHATKSTHPFSIST